jgi:serine/threonine protein kinase
MRTSVYDVHYMIEEHKQSMIDVSLLEMDAVVAQGSTAIVVNGTLRGVGKVAVKIYTSFQVTEEEVFQFSKETALNVQLSHPNVVRFYGLCIVPPTISLVFEFCEYGGLDVVLQSQCTWDLSTKLKAWLDASKSVAYLHSFAPPLLHRDIKTGNFLLGAHL